MLGVTDIIEVVGWAVVIDTVEEDVVAIELDVVAIEDVVGLVVESEEDVVVISVDDDVPVCAGD